MYNAPCVINENPPYVGILVSNMILYAFICACPCLPQCYVLVAYTALQLISSERVNEQQHAG